MADDDERRGKKPKTVADAVKEVLSGIPMVPPIPASVDLRGLSSGVPIEVETASGQRYLFTLKDPGVPSANGAGGAIGPAVTEVVIEGSCASSTGAMLHPGHVTEGWHLSLRTVEKTARVFITTPIVKVYVSGFLVIPRRGVAN